MTTFRHHPDGWIHIGEDCYPLFWFKQQEPGYSLPQGAISREYVSGERHSLYSKDSQWGDAMPWTEGDRYLANQAIYQAAWQAANQPEPTPEPESQPNWVQFRSSVGDHEAYLRIASGHPRNMVLNVQLTALLWRVGEDPSLFVEVAQKWTQMVSNVPLTVIEISQLNAVAEACDVPLRLNAVGRMEVG